MHFFPSLFIIFLIVELKALTLNPVNEFEAARLEEYASLKLIVDYVKIDFYYNFEDLQKENDNLRKQVENPACQTKSCEARKKRLFDDLHKSDGAVKIIFNSLKTEQNSRHKRWDMLGSGLKFVSGILDADDGKKINSDISNINSDQNKIMMKVESIQNRLNALQISIDKIDAFEQISQAVHVFSEKIKSLLKTIITRKFDGSFVNLRDVEDKIELAKANIDSNKYEIAFDAVDCLKFLEVNSEVKKSLRLSIRVPISSKKNFIIKKIITLPTKVEDFILWMRLEWNFVAIDSENNFMILKDLNSCIQDSRKILVCDNQPEIDNVNFRNCVSKIIQFYIVDLKLCSDYILFARLPNTVLIQNDDGELWFNANQLHRLECNCDGINTNETITGNFLITSNKQCTLFIDEISLPIKIKPSKDLNTAGKSAFFDEKITSIISDDFPSSTLSNNQVYDIESFTKIGRKLKNCLILHRFQKIVKDWESFKGICS